MRITEQMSTARTLSGLQSTYSNLSDLQAQLASGRQITKPSDDPNGTVVALQLRTEVAQSNQFQANANAASTWLSQADTAFKGVNASLTAARTLVVQGLNTGILDPISSAAIADHIDSIKAQLLATANATSLGRPIFGGTTAGTLAFTADTSYPGYPGSTGSAGVSGIGFVGNAGTIVKDVGPNASVQVNQVGPAVFGPNGSNVFDLLTKISAALRGTSGVSLASLNPLTGLDTAIGQASQQQSLEGAAMNQVSLAQTNVTNNVLQYQTQLSSLQDIDLASMAVAVQSANTTYQAALATTAKISQVSLLDFLK